MQKVEFKEILKQYEPVNLQNMLKSLTYYIFVPYLTLITLSAYLISMIRFLGLNFKQFFKEK